MLSFSSLFPVSKSLILVSKLSNVPWWILVEVFGSFADVNVSFFMVWSSSMKNDFMAIILSHTFASSESNFELNDKLITEFEWKGRRVEGVTNDPIFGVSIAGPDVWVRITGFVVALMTSESTWSVIQTSYCMMEKSGDFDDSVTKGL